MFGVVSESSCTYECIISSPASLHACFFIGHTKYQAPGVSELPKHRPGRGWNPTIKNRLESEHQNFKNPIMLRYPVIENEMPVTTDTNITPPPPQTHRTNKNKVPPSV